MVPASTQARVEELQRETRSPWAVLSVLLMAALLAFAPLIPGVSDALGVQLEHTVPAMLAFGTCTVVATLLYHLTGLSRVYWAFETLESFSVVGSLLYLVYASSSAVSLFWLFVLLHGFLDALTNPAPRRHQLVSFVFAPLTLALAFLWVKGSLGDAITTLLLGASVYWIVRVVMRTTRRLATVIDEKEALARDLSVLRVKEERSRIARDLHDSLGADLTSVLWQARALEDTFEGRPEAERAAELSERIARSIQELRQVVRVMRAEPQRFGDFVDELQRRCQEVARLEVRIEPGQAPADLLLDGALAHDVMHTAVEMVRNADQHARASRIRLILRAGERLVLSVEDDGVGLSEDAFASSTGGLRSLHERAQALAGKLTWTALQSGTLLTLDVPLRKAALSHEHALFVNGTST